jgi:hypothetical protein
MATDPPVVCVRCGSETELYRADIPYCLNCIEEIDRQAPQTLKPLEHPPRK